ncbi:MAG: hypothetical protein QOH23_178 [Gaiellaceae bacterium]|nr:hypothetical protein [Gaiellaceae bacterium]
MAEVNVRFCDAFAAGFGWIVDEFMERCSHALVVDGSVWVIDPVDGDGVEERIRAAGTPAGVVQLLDRHNRDCAAIAARLGVRHHVVPQGSLGPFACISVKESKSWGEIALWWPDRRVLVSADALGTARYYRADHDRLAVHPLLRLRPPRMLAPLRPEVVLCGHGEGVLTGASAALREALSTSRRRIFGQLAAAFGAWRARRPS